MLFLSLVALIAAWALLNRPTPLGPENVVALRLLVENLPVTQNIHIREDSPGLRFPDLVAAAQAQLDHRLRNENVSFHYSLVDHLPQNIGRLDRSRTIEAGPMITTYDESAETNTALTNLPTSEDTFADRTAPEYSVGLVFANTNSMFLDYLKPKVILSYNMDTVHRNDLPFFLVQAIFDHLLEADLALGNLKNGSFSNYKPHFEIGFVAVEESGSTPKEIQSAIKKHFSEIISFLAPFAKVTIRFFAVDVTKSRVPVAQAKNSSDTVNFFYLTSLEGFANSIQGVLIFHMGLEKQNETLGEEKLYGTALLEKQKYSSHPTYNITAFVQDATRTLLESIGIPFSSSSNLLMRVESALKFYTITGIVEKLDQLAGDFNEKSFLQVAGLVDEILSNNEHDWKKYLLQVSKWHE